jgi:hypothetical protein
MTRRLLIADRYDARAFSRAAGAAAAGDAVDVLLLGLSPSWFRWQHPARAATLSACRLIDPAPFAEAAHALVRRFVVEFIAALPTFDLGGQTLERLLHDEDGNTWWYLETSEKGPYRGPLVAQLYALAVASVVIDRGSYAQILHSVRDSLLADALGSAGAPAAVDAGGQDRRASTPALEGWPLLRYWVHAGASLARLAAAWSLPQAVDARDRTTHGKRIIFTAFPGWWANATGSESHERFFAAADQTHVAGYLALVTPSAGLWRQRSAVRRTAERHRIVFLQHFTTFADVLALLSPRRFGRLLAFQRVWRHKLRARFAGFEVGPLIARDITRSLSGGEPFQDVVLARTARRAVDRLTPSTILYRAEFQPAENALLRATEGRAARIGFVHFPFGENYLPTQFAPGEISRYLRRTGDPDSRPLPDGLIAGGEAIAEHVTSTGFPPARVALCGPLRYASLIRYRGAQSGRPELRARLRLPAHATIIFVALAIIEADTEALFGALVEASSSDGTELHFVIRTHPNRPAGDRALETTLASLGAQRASLMPGGAAIYDYIAASDAMVCIGSMIAFEAMALGVMPIVFDNPATYGAVSLAEYGAGLFVARSADDLRAAIHHVVDDSSEAAAKRQAWPRQLSRVFGDLDRPAGEQFSAALQALSC